MDPSSTYELPPRIALWDLKLEQAKKLALEMGLSQSEAKKAAEDAAAEEEKKCLAEEAAGEGEKVYEGESLVNTE